MTNLNLLLIIIFSLIGVVTAIFDATYKKKTAYIDLLCSIITVISAIIVGINLAKLL